MRARRKTDRHVVEASLPGSINATAVGATRSKLMVFLAYYEFLDFCCLILISILITLKVQPEVPKT